MPRLRTRLARAVAVADDECTAMMPEVGSGQVSPTSTCLLLVARQGDDLVLLGITPWL